MLINVIIGTAFYALMLWFGHLMCFVESVIYLSIPMFTILLLLVIRLYDENCRAMEGKDFVICAIFVGVISILYHRSGHSLSNDIVVFLYLASFVPYVAYASSIRYKSLM